MKGNRESLLCQVKIRDVWPDVSDATYDPDLAITTGPSLKTQDTGVRGKNPPFMVMRVSVSVSCLLYLQTIRTLNPKP